MCVRHLLRQQVAFLAYERLVAGVHLVLPVELLPERGAGQPQVLVHTVQLVLNTLLLLRVKLPTNSKSTVNSLQ